MASMIAGGLFNAVAFAGARFLFSKLSHSGYENKIKRHNEALKKLPKEKEKWYENQVEKKNEIEMFRRQLSDANADINDTSHALDAPRKVQTIQYQGKTFTQEPEISDYYEPSDEMKEFQYIVVGLMGFGVGRAFVK